MRCSGSQSSRSDAYGRKIVKDFLMRGGRFRSIEDSVGKYCSYDLVGVTSKGLRVGLEVKYRKGYASTQFNDNCCCEEKVLSNLRKVGNGSLDAAYLVSVYPKDGIIRISNLQWEHRVETRLCPQTSEFRNRRPVTKRLALFERFLQFDYRI